MKNRPEDARKVLVKLHATKAGDSHDFAEQEFRILKTQIDFESHSKLSILTILKRVPLRKRLTIGFITMFGTQCIGTLIILGQYIPPVSTLSAVLIAGNSVWSHHFWLTWLRPFHHCPSVRCLDRHQPDRQSYRRLAQ